MSTLPGLRNFVSKTFVGISIAALVLVSAPAATEAQDVPNCAESPECESPRGPNQPLKAPHEITPDGGVLDTDLDIRYYTGVEVSDDTNLSLRMYGYEDRGEWTFTLPGPTYRIRKGENFVLKLKNSLENAPASSHEECNEYPQAIEPPDIFPNCFHGNNTTNFHFHGFHVSPKPGFDDIFLALNPGEETTIRSGTIPENQAEGTHWYHPHHHGATALQVVNGMAGAFIVEGAFDDWLNGYYEERGFDLKEQIMILQQVTSDITFPSGLQFPDMGDLGFLVNGQLSPIVSIPDGAVERWRFISATTRLSSMITVTFPAGWEVRQIAQDGVQFADANYKEQPLREGSQAGGYQFDLAPGNRADFLVQRVGAEETSVHWEMVHPTVLQPAILRQIRSKHLDPLFSIRAHTAPVGVAAEPQMPFPDTWYNAPFDPESANPFLRNVLDSEIKRDRCVVFSMDGATANPSDIVRFFIDGRKFQSDCIDQRMVLNEAERWTFLNEQLGSGGPIAHPAHIHVNPFQVWVRNGEPHPNAYPIWQDTIALPLDSTEETVIRQRFLNFDGTFVMHCHILGHEDRGMMQHLEVGDGSGLPLCAELVEDPLCESHLGGGD